jgi:RNA-directed DNA polymerase
MDMDRQADEAWILSVQSKLYQWSQANPGDQWRDMWGWLTDIRTLRCAWQRVASNRGARTAGVDGMTVGHIRANKGEQRFLEKLQAELRSGAYRPSPSRRILIPKAGKPGQFRPLGIPTIKDRVAQGAVKLLLEPIFEAQFWHVSYGFGPDEAATALWSTSADAPCRRNAIRTNDGAGCRTHGLSRATSKAASTIFRTTT